MTDDEKLAGATEELNEARMQVERELIQARAQIDRLKMQVAALKEREARWNKLLSDSVTALAHEVSKLKQEAREADLNN